MILWVLQMMYLFSSAKLEEYDIITGQFFIEIYKMQRFDWSVLAYFRLDVVTIDTVCQQSNIIDWQIPINVNYTTTLMFTTRK